MTIKKLFTGLNIHIALVVVSLSTNTETAKQLFPLQNDCVMIAK